MQNVPEPNQANSSNAYLQPMTLSPFIQTAGGVCDPGDPNACPPGWRYKSCQPPDDPECENFPPTCIPDCPPNWNIDEHGFYKSPSGHGFHCPNGWTWDGKFCITPSKSACSSGWQPHPDIAFFLCNSWRWKVCMSSKLGIRRDCKGMFASGC